MPDADLREAGQQRAALQPLPHHGPLLADAHGAAHRPQPSRQQRRRDHGAGDRVPRQHGRAAQERRAAGRDPAAERLQHRRLRQVPRDAAVGSVGLRARSTAGRRARASTSSTASSAARRTSGRRPSTTASPASRRRTIPNYHFTTDMTNQAIAWVALPAGPDAGQAVLHVLRDRRHARPAPRAQGIHRQVQGQVRPGLGQAARGDAGAADRAGRRAGGDQAHRRGPRRSRRGTRSPADQKRLFARQMETFAGFAEHTDHEVGRLVQALEDMGELDNTLVLLHRRRQRLQRRRRAGRHATTRCSRSTASSATSPRSCRTSTSGAGRRPSRTSPSAGRTPATRRSSGPSRWRRTSAARATRWSSTGPSGIKAKGEVRSQFHHVIDVAPTVLEAAGLPRADDRSTARSSGRWTACRCSTRSTTPRPRTAAPRSTSRCSATAPSTTTAGWRRRGTRFRG